MDKKPYLLKKKTEPIIIPNYTKVASLVDTKSILLYYLKLSQTFLKSNNHFHYN
jgi:hypothetical protein